MDSSPPELELQCPSCNAQAESDQLAARFECWNQRTLARFAADVYIEHNRLKGMHAAVLKILTP